MLGSAMLLSTASIFTTVLLNWLEVPKIMRRALFFTFGMFVGLRIF